MIRLQTFDKITTYPNRANAIKVCENEMMIVRGYFIKNYTDHQFYDLNNIATKIT